MVGTSDTVFDTVEEFWDQADALAARDLMLVHQDDPIKEFERAFANFIGAEDAGFLISGREAIYQALGLLNVGAGDEVIMPAFLCSTVADAVLRRGAMPVLVDVRLPTGDMNLTLALEALTSKTKAVLIPHFYGIPLDFRGIKDELEQRGVAIIEDCAHCLGGKIGGVTAGSLGTFSIFSFNYDKPISLGNGGMLVCSDHRWLGLFKTWKEKQSKRFLSDPHEEFQAVKEFLDLIAYRRDRIPETKVPGRLIRLKKWLLQYRWVRDLRDRFRSKESLSNLESLQRVGPLRAMLGLGLLPRYPKIASVRNQNAAYLLDRLRDITWVETGEIPSSIQPAYLRVNMFASRLATWEVDLVSARLCQAGFRAGRFNWPVSLDQVPHLSGKVSQHAELSNSHKMARHCLNLPIHQNMSRFDLDRMVEELSSASH